MATVGGAIEEPLRREDLTPVPLVTLRAVEATGFDLYLLDEASGQAQLYRDSEYPLGAKDLGRLRSAGVETLYTTRSGRARYDRYLREHLGELLADETADTSFRYKLLVHCMRSQVCEAVNCIDLDKTVGLTTNASRHVAGLVGRADFVPEKLFLMAQHDASTFTHLINVSAYAVVLARGLGIEDEEQLQKIAGGALLHDIGKRSIPPAILNKRGTLSPAEKRAIQRHPQTGFEDLVDREDMDWGQLMMVYQHHETMDGRGYPVSLPGREIHELARLCSVVDVFDAITCDRSYRRRMPIPDAIAFLECRAGRQMDKEMVECFNEMVRRGLMSKRLTN